MSPAAAADEVSAAAAKLFGGYAQEYQALLSQAAAFHEEFAAVLGSAGHAYATAEAANASAISGALSQLIGGPIGPVSPALTSLTPAIVQPPLQGTTIGWFMGGSGLPIPPPSYVTAVLNYVNHGFNVLPQNANPLFTPEGYYPLILKSLPLTPSISQGLQILDAQIKSTLAANPGDSVAILGYSQSADISSLEMINLANPHLNPNPPSANQLSFTLLGNQMNPNGGMFARFPGFGGHPLQFPALGLTLYGATPSDTIYPTNIYTIQYDGWADFPRYPINLLSDLNAELGIAFVHGTYPSLNPSALPPGYEPGDIADVAGLQRRHQLLHDHHTQRPAAAGAAAVDTGHRQPTGRSAATGPDDDRQHGLRKPATMATAPPQPTSKRISGCSPTTARPCSRRTCSLEPTREPSPSTATSKRKPRHRWPTCRINWPRWEQPAAERPPCTP